MNISSLASSYKTMKIKIKNKQKTPKHIPTMKLCTISYCRQEYKLVQALQTSILKSHPTNTLDQLRNNTFQVIHCGIVFNNCKRVNWLALIKNGTITQYSASIKKNKKVHAMKRVSGNVASLRGEKVLPKEYTEYQLPFV